MVSVMSGAVGQGCGLSDKRACGCTSGYLSRMKLLALACLVGLIALVGACSKDAAEQYTVRGKVVGVGATATDKIDIHHEAIPAYKHRDGKVRGMASMVMSFAPTGPNLPTVVVGDLVRVTFSVHWDSDPGTRIEAMEKLPPDTALVLQ